MTMPLLHIAGQGPEWLQWHLHPDVLVLVAGLLIAYWYAVVVWRPRISGAKRIGRSQAILYCSGVGVIYLAAGSPVHDLAENYLFSVHMTQHMLLSLVAPPLLLAGIPTWLYEAVLLRKGVVAVARVMLNPLVAIFSLNMLLVITHLPHVVDYALTHHWFHFVVHALIVTASVQMWWSVITRVPGLPQLSYPYQMAYLFVQSLVPSVIGSFITFSSTPVYDFYAEAPRIWGMTAVEDQQVAAFIMKVIGSLILWGFIGVAFFKWYERDQADAKLPWSEVEQELSDLGLSPRA